MTPPSKELLKDIKEQYARELHYSSWRFMCESVNIVPRDVSAIAERYATARVEDLERWKREADSLLSPLLDYGQSKEANIPLGANVTTVILQRAKRFEQAKKALEEISKIPDWRKMQIAKDIANKALASWKEEGKEIIRCSGTGKPIEDCDCGSEHK